MLKDQIQIYFIEFCKMQINKNKFVKLEKDANYEMANLFNV